MKSQLTKYKKKENANVTRDKPTSSDSDNEDSDFSDYAKTSAEVEKAAVAEVVDSRCSIHMRPDTKEMENVKANNKNVHLADGSEIKSMAKGNFNPGFCDDSRHNAIVIRSSKNHSFQFQSSLIQALYQCLMTSNACFTKTLRFPAR